jgi:hypothetical protein
MNLESLVAALRHMPEGPKPIEIIMIGPDDFDQIVAIYTDNGAIIVPREFDDDGWCYLIVDFDKCRPRLGLHKWRTRIK